MCRYAVLVLLLGVLVSVGTAAPGDLDPSFGIGGYVRVSFGTDAEANGLAQQPDGKIVLVGLVRNAGSTTSPVMLTRFTKDGKLDTAFGTRGVVRDNFLDPLWTHAVAVAANGKILVAGASKADNHAAVARYNPNGSLDQNFGEQGRSVLDLADSRFEAILVMPDGGIVLAGTAAQANHGDDVLLVELDSSGNLSNTFGQGGMVFVNKRGNDYASSLALDNTGHIVVGATTAKPGYGGRFSGDLLILRFLSNGQPDVTFGNQGAVVQDLYQEYDTVEKVSVTSGNITVVAGTELTSEVGFIVNLQSDGRRLQPFGRNGVVETQDPASFASYDLAVQADGSILLCGTGHQSSATYSHGIVYRFLPNGRADTSFHEDGARAIGFGQAGSDIHACALAGSSKLVVAGYAQSGTHRMLALGRILLK